METNNVSPESVRELKQYAALSEVIKNNFWGLINVVMRYGKTFIGISVVDEVWTEFIQRFKIARQADPNVFFVKPKTLWITNDIEARDKTLKAEFKKAGKEYLLDSTKFICWKSLKNEVGEYDLIIADEYQFITEGNSENLFNGKLTTKRFVGLTGTEPRDYGKRFILNKLKLKEIFKIDLQEAIEDKVISDYRVTVIKFDLDKSNHYIKQTWGGDTTERTKYEQLTKRIQMLEDDGKNTTQIRGVRMKLLYSSIARKSVIQKLQTYLNSKSRRGLIFTPFKNFAESFKHFYHSTSTSNHYDRFQNNEINSLALVKSGGVGRTYKDIDYIVIGNPTRDYNGITTQNWGRGLLYKEGAPIDIYFICSTNTVEEEKWLVEALKNLDPNKISYTTIEEVLRK